MLIVLGITCALWFDGVKDARAQRQLEVSILREMVGTLESDTTDFRTTVRGLAGTAAALDTVLLYLGEGRDYDSKLADDFSLLAAGFGFFPNRAAYEDLRASGLGVVSNASLRQQIVHYYDFQLPAIHIIEEMRAFPYRGDHLLPQMHKKFAWDDSAEWFRATPNDYQSLSSDIEFLNVLRGWAREVNLQARLTSEGHQASEKLLRAIQGELSQR